MTVRPAGLGPGRDAYQTVLSDLERRGRFGVRLGLGRTRALLRALGEPQLSVRGPLIGGTNGKGSVQALVASALRAAGLRVGQTPKPHLVSYRERIVIDGRPLDAAGFSALLTEVLATADRPLPRIGRRLGAPTEFEVMTAAAFLAFARANVDVAVVEVGLGGRLDATHVWDGGVAAITNVERDHMQHLGGTRVEIAREKAAIIERGDRAVTAAQGEALAVIRRRCRRLGVPLVAVKPLPILATDRSGIRVRHDRLGELSIGLRGRHQAENAAVAVAVLDALGEARIAAVSDDGIRRGLAEARWPGRLELVSAQPPITPRPTDVLLDGAHNAAGAAALATALDDLAPDLDGGRATVLMAVVVDKEVDAIVTALSASRLVAGAGLVVTVVPGTPRSLDPDTLAAAWRGERQRRGTRDADVDVVADPDAALARALARASAAGGPLVVCGSLYLVGHVRGRLVDDPDLRDP